MDAKPRPSSVSSHLWNSHFDDRRRVQVFVWLSTASTLEINARCPRSAFLEAVPRHAAPLASVKKQNQDQCGSDVKEQAAFPSIDSIDRQ